jgi:DNA primase
MAGRKPNGDEENRWPLADDRVTQVKQANDIVDVVGGYLALRPVGGTFKGLCPFHEDTHPSFDVDPRRQRFRCWSCGKYGDVLSFVQEFEHVTFPEALELLARRAGITLERTGNANQGQGRAHLLDVMRWAAKQFHECLLDSTLAEAEQARGYLGERGLRGETVRRWGLGFAPGSGQWLISQAERQQVSLELLEQVGLIAARSEGPGHYDRFRDRVQFPIRDVRGQAVGFGGRILPTSPLASRGPKYINSTETPLFSKSEVLYGLDQARGPAEKAGYLAVVEGYTDVLMAHQLGVPQVVATMGTALNARHVHQIRRFVKRVVLVFDADAGGETGVDRALEIFASQDMELSIATLPAGLDPCDMLLRDGADAFRRVLESAKDALEFKLTQMVTRENTASVEGHRRVLDAVLGVIALASPLAGEAGAIKTQLMVNRIARRLTLKEENVWARLNELRKQRRGNEAPRARPSAGRGEPGVSAPGGEDGEPAPSAAPAALQERQLLEVLLADPALVARAADVIGADEIEHPGLRRLLQGLYNLLAAGEVPALDSLRPALENSRLAEKALELQEVGQKYSDRETSFGQLLVHFQQRRDKSVQQELQSQLQSASDHQAALDLLRQLQKNRSRELGPDTSSREDGAGNTPPAPSA